MASRREFVRSATLSTLGATFCMTVPTMRFKDAVAADTRKIGIIGLDTSHSPAFAQFFNNPANEAQTRGFRVTAAYPYGSQLIESSRSRIAGYTKEIKRSGVRICPSIKSLLSQVDYVLLETNDGNLHLAQMREIVRAKKPVFIDKPVAATLQDVYSIYDLAREANLPVFSASSLRYMVKAQQAASGLYGKVLGADTFSPATLDQSHTDLYWYGIHGVELLFTVMGPGCKVVQRVSGAETDIVVGTWQDGRVGIFRGTRNGPHAYGGHVFADKAVVSLDDYNGNTALLNQIVQFFDTGKAPVPAEQTLEIYRFMTAADESKKRNGAAVLLADINPS